MIRHPWMPLAALLVAAAIQAGEISGTFIDRHQGYLAPLFEQLDPAHPAAGPIRAEWRAGGRLAAAAALERHLAERAVAADWLPPLYLPAGLLAHADAALAGRFELLDEWETLARRPDGGPDWRDRGRRADKERAWMLNRHRFLPILAAAWEQTGNERYKDALNALWQDWILNNPYPDRLTFSPPWRALEVARRILNAWTHVLIESPEVIEPETRLLALRSLLDHGDALREHASFWGGNHLITEKTALLTLAVAWPELQPATEWRDYAIDQVTRQLARQTYPDGSYKELSNHYQRVVLHNAQRFLRLLAAVDPEYRRRPVVGMIERMWDFHAGLMRPDGYGPLSNASDREHNASQVLAVWEFHDRPDWRYIATNGAAGSRPDSAPSRLYPWAGQAILRSGWERTAHWAYFDAGPYGTAHQHVDRFQVSASIGGRQLLTDTGRYIYQPGRWKDYFQGHAGHNILLLDGQPAEQGPRKVSQPLPVAFQADEYASFAAARGRFAAPGGSGLSLTAAVPWTRAVLLDHRGCLLVIDHLVAFSSHTVQASWHFAPGVSPQQATAALRLVNPSEQFDAATLRGHETPEPAGFYSPQYNQREPITLRRYTGRIDRPTTLVWILQSPDAPPANVTILSQPGDPQLRLRLQPEGALPAEIAIQLHPRPELRGFWPVSAQSDSFPDN
jgi:hypothetical protein